MTPCPFSHLLARHLRFQRDLLALRRHAASIGQSPATRDWDQWVKGRQPLLDRIGDADTAQLAADTAALLRGNGDHPLASLLQRLRSRHLATMQALLHQEDLLRRTFESDIAQLARRLLTARRAHLARDKYHRQRPRLSRLDGRG